MSTTKFIDGDGTKKIFETVKSKHVLKAGDTMSGDLATQNLYPDLGNMRTLGTEAKPYLTLFAKYLALGGKVSHTAGFHNSIFRGASIQAYYEDGSLYNRIIGNGYNLFEDLYVGDYFDVSITTSYGGTETVRLVIAGFDLFWNNGDNALTTHHAVIVPKDCFTTTAQMMSSNVTTSGYYGTVMHGTTLPVYKTALDSVLGSHILKHRAILSTSGATSGASMAGAGWSGYANNWAWQDTYLSLMSEVQVYGCTVFSSSFFDVGNRNLQFPLFRLAPDYKVAGLGYNGSRYTWGLSAVASSTYFAYVNGSGNSYYGNASFASGVRPYFLLS